MGSLCCYSDYTIHIETAKITINQRQLIGMLSGGVLLSINHLYNQLQVLV